ncbi:hypothetical protein GCK32_018594, partial [Trichostrongylus colubriformis]
MSDKDAFKINLSDEVVRGATVLHEGQLMWPPPAPVDPSPVKAKEVIETTVAPVEPTPFVKTARKASLITSGLGTLPVLGVISPDLDFAAMTTTFALAGIVG